MKTPQEMRDINVKCAELLSLEYKVVNINFIAVNGMIFSIFTSYADLMAVAEKLDLTIQRRLAKVLDDYACHRGGECLKSSKSMRKAILECVIAVVEGL